MHGLNMPKVIVRTSAQVGLEKVLSFMTLTEAASLCRSLMTSSQKKTRGSSTELSNRYHSGPLYTDVIITVAIITSVNDTHKIS